MNKNILNLAIKKFKQLEKKYKGFINIGLDNWRGYRFVFDTEDVQKCKNNCLKCHLYLLLKNEKGKVFSATLCLASKKDKKIFGPQKYLNCKTLEQYKNCYVNFLIKKTKTKKEIREELILIKNFKIIFSKKSSNLKILENEFRKSIIQRTLMKTGKRKARIIKELIKQLDFY
ncbi:hypothetical protein ISS85_00160 [Candidatus Microgenomates bacterium]|nr:hypothetical protein [Candidatus Microgenomates bacterium]